MAGRCPVCAEVAERETVRCADCAAVYHRTCHEYLGRCGIYGCGNSRAAGRLLPGPVGLPGWLAAAGVLLILNGIAAGVALLTLPGLFLLDAWSAASASLEAGIIYGLMSLVLGACRLAAEVRSAAGRTAWLQVQFGTAFILIAIAGPFTAYLAMGQIVLGGGLLLVAELPLGRAG